MSMLIARSQRQPNGDLLQSISQHGYTPWDKTGCKTRDSVFAGEPDHGRHPALFLFCSMRQLRLMPDAARLTPADPSDLANALAFALRYNGRKRVHDAAERMARTVAKRLSWGGRHRDCIVPKGDEIWQTGLASQLAHCLGVRTRVRRFRPSAPETEDDDGRKSQTDSKRGNRSSSQADAGRRSVGWPAQGLSGKPMRQAIESD
jgi:hypothetical protein